MMWSKRLATAAVLLALPAAGAACHRGQDLVVVRATYGASCGAAAGNVTWPVAERCTGAAPCRVELTPEMLGDPAEGCEKDFEVLWACRRGPAGTRRGYTPGATSFRAVVVLACD